MNGLSLLIIIIVIAYFYDQRYPQPDTYKMYFGGAVILYLIFIYFMNYQQPFVYKMAIPKIIPCNEEDRYSHSQTLLIRY